MSIRYIKMNWKSNNTRDFYICFVFRCIIEIGHKRKNNDPALRQTGWFQFLHRQLPCSNIPASPEYGVYISQLIRYERACSTYNQFLVRGKYWQISWCHRGFNCLVYRQFNDLICSYNLSLGHMLSDTLSRSWHTDLDYGWYRLLNVEIGLTAGVTGQQGMFTSPWHPIPPLIYSEVHVRPLSDLYFL
jgi:hypothetical protein